MTLADLGTYRLHAPIGQGATGLVFRAETSSGRPIALKVMRPALAADDERRRRFVREARAAAALDHPQIAAVHDIESAVVDPATASALGLTIDAPCDLPFLTMELVEGVDIDALIAEGPMAMDLAFDLADQILAALGAAHGRSVVHRDLKPANIRVTSDLQVKLLDFGLAKILEEADEPVTSVGTDLTLDGMVLGSLPYLSPEQLQGLPVDGRSDLFSFGILFYEMLTGVLPYPNETMVDYARALMLGRLRPASEHRQDLSPEIDDFVERLLDTDPDGRFPTAVATRKALQALRLAQQAQPTIDGERPANERSDDAIAGLHAAPQLQERDPSDTIARDATTTGWIASHRVSTIFLVIFVAALLMLLLL